MSDISREYFMDEIRDGFFAPGMMKRSWAMSTRNYHLLTDTCHKAGAEVNMCFGGMIGAVRYGGWVPWDDDIDTEMLRRDYDILKEKADAGEIPEGHRLVDYNEMDNGNLVRKWMDGNDIIKPEEKWNEDYGFPFVNNVDIFIIDSIPDSEKDSQYYRDVVDLCQHVKYFADDLASGKSIDEEEFTYSLDLLQRVLKTTYKSDRDGSLSLWSWKVMEDFLKRYNEMATKDVGMIMYYMNVLSCKYPRWYYDIYVEMPYEYTSVRLPIGYDGILRTFYGNYMYPKVEYSGHFYPNFKMLEKMSMETYGIGLLAYSYDKEEIKELNNKRNNNDKNDPGNSDNNGIKKVLFLVRKPEHWSSLHSLWKAAKDDENADVTVIAVPYFYRDEQGNINPDEMIVETEGYPEEVTFTAYDKYSFEDEKPNVIVFQDPYDEYHDSYLVHPDFFVKNLRGYTDKLVFIPPFILSEIIPENQRSRITLGFYLKNIGQVLADRIYVQSEGMKDVYKEILSEFADDIDWNARISGIGAPMLDADDGRIRISDENKYVLLYHINVSVLFEHGEKVLDRGRQLMELAEKYATSGLTIRYVEDPNIRKVLPKHKSRLWERYEQFYHDMEEHAQVTIEKDTDFRAVAGKCDGYFGDGSVFMNAVRELKKPVLWQTPWLKLDKPGKESGEWDPERKIMTEGDWDVKHFLDEMIRVTDEGREELSGDRGETYGSKIWKDICSFKAGADMGVSAGCADACGSRDGEALLDEVRDGFLVPGMMKKQWAICLDDCDNLTGVCKDNVLTVFSGWGTLLGAIRHGGFIPWDDDLDMEMLRGDYEKLVSIAGKEEVEGAYHIDDFTTVGNTNTVRRWIDKSVLLYEPEKWADRHGFPLGNAIDIFILDSIPQDEEYETYKRVIYLCETARQKLMAAGDGRDLSLVSAELEELKRITGLTVRDVSGSSDKPGNLPEVRVFELLDEYMKRVSLQADEENKPDNNVGNAALFVRLGTCLFPKKIFKDCIWVDFEDTQIPIPFGYDRILRQEFGAYMNPVRVSYSHSYPAYDLLRDELKEKYDFELLRFKYSEEEYKKIWNERLEKISLSEFVSENIKLLLEAHDYIRSVLSGGGEESSWQEAQGLLGQCQELAIQTGEMIEKRGESTDAVGVLERYCDWVFRTYDAMGAGESGGDSTWDTYLQELSGLEDELQSDKFNHTKSKKEVVFLLDKTGNWNSLHTIWKSAIADEKVHVTVIAVPYQFKDAMGMLSEDWQVDTSGIPDEVELTSYDAYDFELQHPDVIIYQNPYDEYSDVISAHPYFYASNIRKYAERMVFIPPFTLTEITEADPRSKYTLGILVRNPGLIYADRILVQSDEMKQVYTDILMEMMSEKNADGEEINWSERIVGCGSALTDHETKQSANNFKKRRESSTEPKLIFYISGSMLYDNGSQALELKKKAYEYLRDQNIYVRVYEDPYAEQILSETMKDVWEEYKKWMDELRTDGVMIGAESFMDSRDDQDKLRAKEKLSRISRLVDEYDAYYGDGCVIMNEFRLQGKPVLWEQPDKTYTEEGMEAFLKDVKESMTESEVTAFGEKLWKQIVE